VLVWTCQARPVLTVAGWLSALGEHAVSMEKWASRDDPLNAKLDPSVRGRSRVPRGTVSCVEVAAQACHNCGLVGVSWEVLRPEDGLFGFEVLPGL
jgi:hypothetical protein